MTGRFPAVRPRPAPRRRFCQSRCLCRDCSPFLRRRFRAVPRRFRARRPESAFRRRFLRPRRFRFPAFRFSEASASRPSARVPIPLPRPKPAPPPLPIPAPLLCPAPSPGASAGALLFRQRVLNRENGTPAPASDSRRGLRQLHSARPAMQIRNIFGQALPARANRRVLAQWKAQANRRLQTLSRASCPTRNGTEARGLFVGSPAASGVSLLRRSMPPKSGFNRGSVRRRFARSIETLF